MFWDLFLIKFMKDRDLAINKRFNQYAELKGLNRAMIAKDTGIANQSVSNILLSNNIPNLVFITKILGFYKDLSPDWLILGEGEMIRVQDPDAPQTNKSYPISLTEALHQIELLKKDVDYLKKQVADKEALIAAMKK